MILNLSSLRRMISNTIPQLINHDKQLYVYMHYAEIFDKLAFINIH